MSLEVAPLELDFRRPFNREVSQTISLGNRTASPVAFKVKTTAPKRYCVRPNSGRIEPGAVVEVQVLLQAMKEDPPLDQKCRDKFLVQSVAVPADKEFSSVAAIWQDADANKEAMKPFERKIKVAFLPASSAEEQPAEGAAGHARPVDDPPAYTASSPTNVTFSTPSHPTNTTAPAAAAAAAGSTTSTAPSVPPSASAPSAPAAASPDARPAEPPTTTTTTPPPTKRPSPTTDDPARPDIAALRAQLQDARAQIERLKDQLADQGLRQRRLPGKVGRGGDVGGKGTGEAEGGEGLGEGAAALLQAGGEQGVQLNIVAVLCFISFLLGYLFF